MLFRRACLIALALGGSLCPLPAQTKVRRLPDFDIRDGSAAGGTGLSRGIVEQRANALEVLRTTPGMRATAGRFGLPKVMFREGGALTAPASGDAEEIAREFLRSNGSVFPFGRAEIANFRVVVKDDGGSATFLVFQQTLDGIDVFNGQIKFTLTKDGEVVQVAAGDVAPNLSLATKPRLSAEAAARKALGSIGAKVPGRLEAIAGPEGKFAFRNPMGGRLRPIGAELVILPMDAVSARLGYRIFVEADGGNSYEVVIDAEDGGLLFRHGLTLHSAQARVWTQSPLVGSRQLVNLPDGWLPATATVTTGNNADVYIDSTGDDQPDTAAVTGLVNGRAAATGQTFDFAYGDGLTGLDPRGFKPAAVTNLFYYINVAHDYYYGLGFTEAAGNFQTDNLGRGGLGNDAVQGEAQQGDSRNNASFTPTPEGTPPQLRVGLFTRGTSSLTDDLDGDYDGQTVIHEYGHGVSNRLVGGKTSTSCLDNIQSGAMGEGWSDYFALSFYNNPIFDAYDSQNAKTGIRRQSYEGYTFTYEDIGNQGFEVHNDGEIWAATLWDLRKVLGQQVTDALVVNGLKSTPCNPSMIDARDAILAADQATNKGSNRAKIWQVFARHGMGYSSAGSDGDMVGGTIYNAAYDQPPDIVPGGNPKITSQPFQTVALGGHYAYQVTATNPAGGTLAYALSQGPSGMTTDSATGLTQWTATFTGKRVKIAVTDGRGGRVVHGYFLPVRTPLGAGSPIIVDGAEDDLGVADVAVPSGTPVLQVTLRGGTGDADLLLIAPDGTSFDSYNVGNFDTLSIPTPAAGHWVVGVSGYESFTGVSLAANLITPQLIPGNTSITGLNGVESDEAFYRIRVPAGATSLTVLTSGGSGDLDLFMRFGSPAACQESLEVDAPCWLDWYSTKIGNSESINFTSPAAGDYYLDLAAFDAYSGVTLTTVLVSPPALALSASKLAFAAVEGGAAPAAQDLAVSGGSSKAAYQWTAQAITSSGGSWLQLSRDSGSGDTTVQVSVNPASLKAGTYQGTVVVTASSLAASPQSVAVTLTVTARPSLAVGASTLTFQTIAGQDPALQSVTISNAGGGILNWTAAAATSAGGNWLRVSPASGTGNGTVQVSVSAGSLAAGSYTGSVTLTSSGAGNSPVVVLVTLSVGPAGPAISSGGVMGAGGSTPPVAEISVNALVSVFGAGFAPAGTARAVQGDDLNAGVLPTKLAGTCVLAGGVPAFLTYVSPTQVNFLIPSIETSRFVDIQVVSNCGGAGELRSGSVKVWAQQASPEFLYWARNASGPSPVVAVNAVTGALTGPAGLIPGLTLTPAKPGDILTLYGISFGPTSPAVEPGRGSAGSAPTITPPTVSLGAVTLDAADVFYAGASPGTAGLYQLNIRVPAGLADGDYALALSFDIYKAPVGYVPVKN